MRLRRRSQPGPLAVRAYGVEFAIRFGSDELRAHRDALLPPGYELIEAVDAPTEFALEGSAAAGYTASAAGQPVAGHPDLDIILSALDAQIRMFIAVRSPDFIFVHAGVVAVHGKSVLIPGPSFSGKTTLVHEFVRAGSTYFSDEYAVLDRDGRVHPYARRLSIRDEAGRATDRPVHELGGTAAATSAEVGAVLLTRYRPDAVWQPEPVSPGQVALALLTNTLPARDRPKETLQTLTRAVAGAVLLRGDRGEAAVTVPALMAALA